MNIAERIIFLRKQQRWSQEQLAERLGVSRQSVSKWESGASTPDINRILEMSEIFQVSTDYLLKGKEQEQGASEREMPEASLEASAETPENSLELTQAMSEGTHDDADDFVDRSQEKEYTQWSAAPERLMTDEDINGFMQETAEFGKRIAMGVALCITCAAPLIGLTGFTNDGGFLSENTAVLLGLLCLFLMVAIGVALFIRAGMQMNRYKFVKDGEFYLEQGSIQVIEDVLMDFESQFSSGIAKGVALCILSPLPLIVVALLDVSDALVVLMVPVLLILVAMAVNLFIRLGVVKEGFQQLLKRETYDPVNRKKTKQEEKLEGIYWPIVVAIYLTWSFISQDWHISWVIFPIAGMIFAAITNAMKK